MEPAMIRAVVIAFGFALIGQAAAIAQPTVAEAGTVDVTLANFSFTPAMLRFQSNRHYLLRLTNRGSGGHNFTGKAFFDAVRLDAASRKLVVDGKVEVPKGETVEIGLTPVTRGDYQIKCSHFLHSGFGMKGAAVIE
jgi:plastocyanin